MGRLIEASDSAGGTIARAYDPLDRLVSETTALGTVSYAYDAIGRRSQMQAPGVAPVFYGYDAASRLTTITQAPLTPVTFDYDAAGRRTKLTLPNQVATEYQYDPASRLTALIYRNAAGLLGDLTYQYDSAGNRRRVGGSLARTLLPDPVATATHDAANRQLAFGDQTLTFDANGNVTAVAGPTAVTTYAWDARDRLAGVLGPSVTANFTYDVLGRRVGAAVNGVTTEYLYDHVDVVQELRGTAGAAEYLRSLNIDEPLARAATDFYLADGLTSLLGLTDSAGSLVTRYLYDPFGRTEP